MQVETSRGTFEAGWAFSDALGGVIIGIKDDGRRLAEIADFFDGFEWIEWDGARGKKERHHGYSMLSTLAKRSGEVLITLRREDNQ